MVTAVDAVMSATISSERVEVRGISKKVRYAEENERMRVEEKKGCVASLPRHMYTKFWSPTTSGHASMSFSGNCNIAVNNN